MNLKTRFLMKRLFVLGALLFASLGGAMAQTNGYMARAGAYVENGRTVVADPRTTLAVDLTVRKEVVLCGPYARYAQKYLGVMAPLSNKTVYAIEGATVALCDDPMSAVRAGEVPASEIRTMSHSRSDREFAHLQPDKTAMKTLPLEEAAREAATTVFALRRQRMELITGEAGENVFGAGLQAALDEIERLEQSYLELFFGKRTVTTRTVRFFVRPKETSRQYIVCRFSADSGVLPETDLSGDMVLLRIVPSGDTETPYETTKSSGCETFRIADPSECTLLYGSDVLDRRVLPVFEFGRTVKIAVPRK